MKANAGGIGRDEIIAGYRSVRAAMMRVTNAASPVCRKTDFLRAAELLRLETNNGHIDAGEDDIEMLADVALFEPDLKGMRVYDRFLKAPAMRRLAPADQDIARKMATAFFSFFHVAGRHEVAGLWLEDILSKNRRIWIVDEGLEASAPTGLCFAARLFDAGDFHAGFGIVIPLGDATLEAYISLSTMPGMAAGGGALTPYIYANAIHGLAA